MQSLSCKGLLRKLHEDDRGSVSLETVLIIAAVALPVLIFLIKFGWPAIKGFFNQGMSDLQEGAQDAANNGTP